MWVGFGMVIAFPIFGVLDLLTADADYSHAAEDLNSTQDSLSAALGCFLDLLIPF